MSDEHRPDRELQSRFDALRAADAASAPPFETAWADARRAVAAAPAGGRSAKLPGWAAAGAVLAALGITALLVVWRSSGAPDLSAAIAQAKEMSSWSAPTDTLLDPSLATSDSPAASSADRP